MTTTEGSLDRIDEIIDEYLKLGWTEFFSVPYLRLALQLKQSNIIVTPHKTGLSSLSEAFVEF